MSFLAIYLLSSAFAAPFDGGPSDPELEPFVEHPAGDLDPYGDGDDLIGRKWAAGYDLVCFDYVRGATRMNSPLTDEEIDCCREADCSMVTETDPGNCEGTLTSCDCGPSVGQDDLAYLGCVM
jgi:hypothetical protein